VISVNSLSLKFNYGTIPAVICHQGYVFDKIGWE